MEVRIFSGHEVDIESSPNVVVGQVGATDVDALGEAACTAILDSVLAHLESAPLRADAPVPHWTFALVADGELAALEHAIYQQAAAFPALHERIHALVRATAQGAGGHRPCADEETPTGAAGATALALQSRDRIPAYLDYLRECDLDHEVLQADELDAIVQAHGWNDDTITLVVARLTHCCGQHGEEQVGAWLEEGGLDEYLEADSGRAGLLAEMRRALSRAPIPAWGRQDRATGAVAWTEDGLELQLELLGQLLDEEELEAMREHAVAAVGLVD